MLILLTSCAPYRYSTSELVKMPEAESPLYEVIPRHRSQIQCFDIPHWTSWMLFGNDDDGIFGEGDKAHYKPWMKPHLQKAIFWWCRNPLHNFCFYVIGSADRDNKHIPLIYTGPPLSLEVSLNGGKPFFQFELYWSEKSKSTFYFGWRERGNFGIKAKLKGPAHK